MRIGIISDTHGLLRREVIEGLQGVDHIIHAGNIDKKEVLDELEKIAPVTAVRGNADKDWAVYLPEKTLLEFEGNRIYVIHNKGVITKVDSSRRSKERIHVVIELTIPKDLTDTPVSNGNIIKELLMK